MIQQFLHAAPAKSAPEAARQDVIAGAVAVGGIGLFVVTGSQALIDAVRWLFYAGGGSDRIALIALFLNIALILFAWRRYADIQALMVEQAAAEERAKALVSHDQLTRLLTRGSFLELGDELIERCGRDGRSVALQSFDIDQFKKINDVYGHIAGDALLRAISDTLTAAAPEGAPCARVGGNEFAMVMPFAAGDQESVAALAKAIAHQLAQPVDAGGVHLHVTTSVGIAALASDCANMDSLLRRADIATNVAKRDGSRSVVWFDNSMESELRARNDVETGLRRGIPLGEFVPFYQPQVDLATGRICGFEVLARWAHPAGGYVDPDIFIPVAEETGLIADLFDSLFHQALQDARFWDSEITLAVNISAGQLKDPLLAHKILKLITQSGFPARRLEIEITESSLFENLATAQAVVGSLKNHGIMLALDDFGTGYSSLAHLRALPFDRIKIDRSFVSTMSRDPESMAIVRAVTMMADSLGVAVTAEGIEDAITAGSLRTIGCDKGQGWLYGRPLSGEDVYNLLAERDLLAYQAAWSSTVKSISPARRNRSASA